MPVPHLDLAEQKALSLARFLAGALGRARSCPAGALTELKPKEKTNLMKKADLVDVVSQQKNLPRPQVEATIDSLIDAVAEGLARGERIDLRGFGAFAVRESAARSGRNPQTGETIQIAARRVPTFKAGKELRDRVNRPTS
jgi:integration host factor beta subunit